LAWFETDSTNLSENAIVFLMYDVNRLVTIREPPPRATDASYTRGIYTIAGEIGRAVLATSVQPGDHNTSFPDAFKEVDELLVLAQSAAAGPKGRSSLCLFVTHPAAGTVEVIPQDWFNEGDFDFGYQWPTRVLRDPTTRKIVGDGIRLGVFVLDSTHRNVERWCRPLTTER
jgi:hypothetical protein